MTTLYQEAPSRSVETVASESQEEVALLCQAAIDSLTATIENARARDVLGQLREATQATQSLRNLWAALDQPANPPSNSSSSRSTPVATKSVVVCDTQPIVVEGLRTLLNGTPDMKVKESVDSLNELTATLHNCSPSIVMVDRAFGMQPVLNWLSAVKSTTFSGHASPIKVVIWGPVSTPEESFRLLNAGAHAILCKTDPAPRILECLRAAADGSVWIGDSASRQPVHPRSRLSSREQQILELVKCGFKNKDIAQELGIREGTVKIHLRNIFEKTGVRSRHALAIKDICDRSSKSLSSEAAV